MDRIWLENYPPGVPADIDAKACRSICDVFDESVAKFGSHTAFINSGASITYSDLDRLSRNFASYLQGSLHLQKGTRVALVMPNILQFPIALFGVLRTGCIAVNCNPLYTPRELAHQLQDSGAEVVVIVENSAWVLAEVLAQTKVRHVVTTQLGDMLGFARGKLINFVVKRIKRMVPPFALKGAVTFKSALRQGACQRFEAANVDPESIALLQYTGGTTGEPKGAMLTHRNISANLLQLQLWLKSVLEEGRETVITALPLYHIFAMTANCLLFLKLGATDILITNPRDIRRFVKELRKHPFTAISGVNTLYNSLLNDPDFGTLDFSQVRFCGGAGMAVQRVVADKWKRITGKTLVEAYGLTEASPAVTINPPDLADYNGSVGLPLSSTEIAIRDEAGCDLDIGQVGELCVRGPQVMKGYWNRPDETRAVLMADGFLRTGDIATMDNDGFVRIVDRKKDVITVSGFKVYPNEVEEVVALHGGVFEVGAVGVPDPSSGEAVKVIVVKRDPGLTTEELLRHCRKHLTRYKIPRHVDFRTVLPKTSIGKIARRELR